LAWPVIVLVQPEVDDETDVLCTVKPFPWSM